MAENRHRFPLYLHFAIGGLSMILAFFGLLGYAVYGDRSSGTDCDRKLSTRSINTHCAMFVVFRNSFDIPTPDLSSN